MSGYGHGYSGGADELVFRRVRGILNKLTVENFDSLSDQLVRVGINSENVLKGIIILLFEKAVDEPKFCPIYAGVCKRLSEQGPNFEQPDPSDTSADGTAARGPPTFLKLLLRKCQDEFENRSRAEKLAANAGPVARLVPGTEEHRKTLAAHAELKKCRSKMLGNIRFIGELGMRGLLKEKVLHECIRKLCDNVTTPASEDVECLCHLLKTVGLQLDHDKAKSYMDQYFQRMKMMRELDLPARIKFMLDDVMEMRDNNWTERKLQQAHKEGPKSIREIRLQAMEEQLQNSGNRREKQIGLQRIRLLRQEMTQGPPGMDMDMNMGSMMGNFQPPSFSQREHGIPSQPGMFSGMRRSEPLFPNHLQQQYGGTGYFDNNAVQQNQNFSPGYGGAPNNGYGPSSNGYGSQDVRVDAQQHANGRRSSPKLGRLRFGQNISLRPATDLGQGKPGGPVGSMQAPVSQAPKPEKIAPAQSKLPTDKGKKKSLTPEQLDQMCGSLLEEFFSVLDVDEAIRCFKEMKSKKYASKLCFKAIMMALDRKDVDRANACNLMKALVNERGVIQSRALLEAFENVLPQCADLAIDIPKVEHHLGSMASQWVLDNVLDFDEIMSSLKSISAGRTSCATSLLISLKAAKGEADTKKTFEKAGIDLMEILPADRRSEQELLSLLKTNGLAFLYPMLSLKEDFTAELQERFPSAIDDPESDSVATAVRSIFKWIKSLPKEKLCAPTFLRVMSMSLIAHVASITTLLPQESQEHFKELKSKEKNTMQAFGAILQNYAGEDIKKQIQVIYALQVFCHDVQWPRGMMLRMSGHLYDLDIVEEEAWSMWREEVNLDLPGKGDALIAVNEYLNWMRTAAEESEEDSSSDEEIDSVLPKKGLPRRLDE